ncbi:hypothetical protein BG005_009061 [Podila minutissima]|nr:hypothetical protein BG005_009061 [Podila minutissima]
MPFEADPTPDLSRRTETMQTPNPKPVLEPPVVLIAGAGLGGLTAALLCERANINYMVFERAAKVKPLGSAMSMGASTMAAFEQLGMLGELMKISLPCPSVNMYHENLKPIGSMDFSSAKEVSGHDLIFFSRPDFYNLLLSKIPPSKLHMNKKIMSILQNDEGVMIRCSDNTSYHGDILIGADGAYSGVRQSLYKQLDDQGLLPAEDKEEMEMAYLCIVGMAGPLNPEKYPSLKDSRCHFATVLGQGKPHSWTTVTLPENKMSWSAKIQLDRATAKDMMFRNSEWGPEANKAMIKEVYNFPVKQGGVLGDLIDATDKDMISRVYIEEKLFRTWTHGRTALIGDGAVAAMQDAIILVNCIYDIEQVTYKNIQSALADYQSQRFEHAKGQVNLSTMLGQMLYGQKWSQRLLRNIVYNMPKWAQARSHLKGAKYRPSVAFLPPAANPTNLTLDYQKSSTRYAKEQAANAIALT